MAEIRLQRWESAEENGEESHKDNFVKVVKTTRYNSGKNFECKVHELYHYHHQGDLEKGPIIVTSKEFKGDLKELEPAEEVDAISVGEKEDNEESQDDESVVIEEGDDKSQGACCLSTNDCGPLPCDYANYVSVNSDLAFNDDGDNCVKSLVTNLNLVLMLFALLVPVLLHTFCEFRLYNNLSDIASRAKGGTRTSQEVSKGVLKYLAEFENFFFLGVMLYVAIQSIGFVITASRYHVYLRHLALEAIDNARDSLLERHKAESLERLVRYAKSISMDRGILRNTKRSLLKSFDEISLMFNPSKVDYIWEMNPMMKVKIFLLKIWFPFGVNVCLSAVVCLYFYYKRLRLNYRVPLGHPKIVSNLYWYVAVQYEGFAWIIATFLLNVITWALLCAINSHRHVFKTLDDAMVVMTETMEDLAGQTSRMIWEREMFYVVRNTYTDLDSSESCPEYPEQQHERTKQQGARPCLCRYVCNVGGGDQIDLKSKSGDLSVTLLGGRVKSVYRKF